MQGASELPGPHDDLFLAVIVEHLTVESVTSGPALRIPGVRLVSLRDAARTTVRQLSCTVMSRRR